MLFGLLLPLAGTTVGAAGVFCMRRAPGGRLQRSLDGFAAGVMTAASVWSLLLPAMAQSAHLGRWAFLPAALGIGAGAALLWVLNRVLQPMEQKLAGEGIASPMLLLAVSLHNLPEGMAVGAVLAGLAAGKSGITAAAVGALAMGIALQNIPEGAIISLPLRAGGMGKGRAFGIGILSGVVEPLGAVLTLLLAQVMVPVLPYLLSLAAGAMLYVVAEELVPELRDSRGDDAGTLCFALGFTLMMAMDAAFS